MKTLDLNKPSLSTSFDRYINDTIKSTQEQIFGQERKSSYGFSFSSKALKERILKEYNALLKFRGLWK